MAETDLGLADLRYAFWGGPANERGLLQGWINNNFTADDMVFKDPATGELVDSDGVSMDTSLTRVDYGADHTLTATDLGKRLRATAALTLTLPADATEDLDDDHPVEVYAVGGAVTIAADTGVTIRGGTSLDQFGTVSIVKDGADEFVVVGEAS